MKSNDEIISRDEESEEFLRNVSQSDNYLNVSPIFPSRLKKFGNLSLAPKINLGNDEVPLGKNVSLVTGDKDIFHLKPIKKKVSGNVKCETPPNYTVAPLNNKKLKKKSLKPTDYIARPSCKRLRLSSLGDSKKFTRALHKKKRRTNITDENKKENNGQVELMEWSSPENSDTNSFIIPLLNNSAQWSPISGCSPLSSSASEVSDSYSGGELKTIDVGQLSSLLDVPYFPQMVTSTPVDVVANFDYNISSITEGNEGSSVPLILKQSRFCCSSQILLSDTNSEYSGEDILNIDKENIDPDRNRAAFDAFVRNYHMLNCIREDKIKCTYNRIGLNQRPLEELIQISFSASQPVPFLKPDITTRLSNSQPDISTENRNSPNSPA